MILELSLLILTQTSPAGELRIEGEKGVEILGFCVSSKNNEKREFEGRLPYQVSVDLNIQSCEVKKKNPEEKRGITLKLFHKNEMIYSNQFQNPTIGIQFVIPWK